MAGSIGDKGSELHKVQFVVQDLSGVVEDSALGAADDFFQGFSLEFGAGDKLVQVVHIGLQVLSVVERQGLVADDRGQGGIRERNKRKHVFND